MPMSVLYSKNEEFLSGEVKEFSKDMSADSDPGPRTTPTLERILFLFSERFVMFQLIFGSCVLEIAICMHLFVIPGQVSIEKSALLDPVIGVDTIEEKGYPA